jgi:hypothetical protein
MGKFAPHTILQRDARKEAWGGGQREAKKIAEREPKLSNQKEF